MGGLNAAEIERAGDAIAEEVMELADRLMAQHPELDRVEAVNKAIALLSGAK